MASILCLEGMIKVYIFVSDVVFGRPWFAWGPEEYSGVLLLVSALNGVLSIAMGVSCLRDMSTLDPKRVKVFARFLAYISLCSVMWYVAVGSPRRIALKEEPVVKVWPLSTFSVFPHKEVVDPEWPLGRPTVCDDITDFV